jgi:hypothetical protein
MAKTLYVKTLDGKSWYVGLGPMKPEASDKIAGFVYCARAWTPAENKEHALSYARACANYPAFPAYVGASIVVQEAAR